MSTFAAMESTCVEFLILLSKSTNGQLGFWKSRLKWHVAASATSSLSASWNVKMHILAQSNASMLRCNTRNSWGSVCKKTQQPRATQDPLFEHIHVISPKRCDEATRK